MYVLDEEKRVWNRELSPTHLARPVAGRAMVSVANPYRSLWWAAIGLACILWARQLGFAGVTFFYIGHILSDLVGIA